EKSAAELWAQLKPAGAKVAEPVTKSTDTLDVWIDSGSSSRAVIARRQEIRGRDKPFQADMYLEGSDQHRGLKPAAMLVAAFQIHIRLERFVASADFLTTRDYRARRGTRIDPNIQGISGLGHRLSNLGTSRLELGPEFRGGLFKPHIRALLLDQIGRVTHHGRIQDSFAAGIVKGRDWHTPGPLPRNAPVGPGLDRGMDSIFAPVRHPLDPVDFRQCPRAKASM